MTINEKLQYKIIAKLIKTVYTVLFQYKHFPSIIF